MVSATSWCLTGMNKLGTQARMNRFTRQSISAFGLMVSFFGALPSLANGLEALEQFLKTSRSGRAEFTQVVTTPGKADQPARSKTSTGSFAFVRPQLFRFDYQKPFVQHIVADGQTLWLYDPDLAQVTARPQAQVLGSTPAAWLTSGQDLSAMQKDFQFQAQPEAQGLQWVLALPKARDAALQSVRIGLRQEAQGMVLAVLEISDAFGQRSVLSFDRFEVTPAGLGAGQFKFVPPKGVDIVRP